MEFKKEGLEKKIISGFVAKIERRAEQLQQTGTVLEEDEIKTVALNKIETIKCIYSEFNEVLKERFNNSLSFYKHKMVELKKDLCSAIAEVEGVAVSSVFDLFEEIVEKKSREFESLTGKFIFIKSKSEFNDEFTRELKKQGYNVIVDTFFPFNLLNPNFLNDRTKLYYIYRLIFVLSRSRFEVAEVWDIEEREQSVGQKVFEEILFAALDQNATDIHIIPYANIYSVFFRINGFFVLQKSYTLSSERGDALLTYLMRRAAEEVGGKFNPDTRLAYQDARINIPEAYQKKGIDLDVRIAFVPNGLPKAGMEACLRLLYKTKKSIENISLELALKKLGYLEEDIHVLKNVLYRKSGIVVISGITNSGKSTLVVNLLSYINDRKIGTIEDPIEYFVDNFNYVQHQIFISTKEEIKMDFVDYVKAFKRSDYDIVFIGEWRKHKGLTEAMIEQAYAGQLIFTTLHIGNSFQIFEALKSIFDVKVEEIKPILILSWNQILVPKLCDNCKVEVEDYSVSSETLSIVKDAPSVNEEMVKRIERYRAEKHFVKGSGCEKCRGSGYEGRQVVYDYFIPTVDLWDKVGNDYSSLAVLKNARIKKTKLDVFFELAEKGVVSLEDVYRVV